MSADGLVSDFLFFYFFLVNGFGADFLGYFTIRTGIVNTLAPDRFVF